MRDNALNIAGLLVLKIGGPASSRISPGYWENLNFLRAHHEADTGESQYRRGYT